MFSNAERDLEDMLPELDALLERGLFTKEELQQVLERREKYEYAIRSATRTQQDFCKYIEFEEKLEELRKLRSGKLKKEGDKVKKSDITEFCIVRHVHSLYSKATFTFKTDLELWKQWFTFCRSSSSAQRLSKAISDALRYNPHAVDIWIYAAHWEFSERQNVNLARSLMQQGLRNCRSSEALWVAYFKLELEVARRLWERQQVLEETTQSEGGDGLGKILDGSMALCVFREAIRAIPSSFEFRKRLLDVVADESVPNQEMLTTEIFKTIEQDFRNEGEMWDMKASFEFSQAAHLDVVAQVERAMGVYSEGLKWGEASDLYSYALLFLADIWNSCQTQETDQQNDESGRQEREVFSEAVFQQMKSLVKKAVELSSLTEKAVVVFAEICRKQKNESCLLDILLKALEKFPTSKSISTAWINAVKEDYMRREAPSKEETSEALLKTVRGGSRVPDIWRQVIETYCDLHLNLSPLCHLHFHHIQRILSEKEKSDTSAISCHFLKAFKARGMQEEAMECAKTCMDAPFMDASVYLAILDLFQSQSSLESPTITVKGIQQLFEKAIRAHGSSSVELWIELMRFEHRHGRRELGKVYQRALHSGLQDLRPLEDAMRTVQ